MSPLYRGFHQNDEGTEEIFMKNKRIKGNWIFGYLVPLHDNTFAIIDEPIERWGTNYTPVEKEVINETICEWTRLYDNTKWENITESEQQAFLLTKKENENYNTKKDWKGRRIFENDIVKFSYSDCGEIYEATSLVMQTSDGWSPFIWTAPCKPEKGLSYSTSATIVGHAFDSVRSAIR